MRRSFLVPISLAVPLVCLLCLAPATAQTGVWTRLDDGPRRFQSRFDDVFFVSPDTGWVVSTAGDVYQTTNGGFDWSHLIDDGGHAFRSVGFVDAEHGFVGTLSFNSVLLETQDGGQSWTNISNRIVGPVPQGICGLSVVDENHIFGVGRFNGPAIFIKTTDGGQTWTSKNLSPMAETLIDVHFFNRFEGIAVGGSSNNLGSGNRAVVLATTDGGETWEQRTITNGPNSEWGWKISFPSRFVGYVSVEYVSSSGTAAKVLRTVDGGAKWQELEIGPSRESRGLQGLGFVTNTLGWAGGRGATSQTSQSGDLWQLFPTIDGRVNRFRFLGDTLGYAVGEYVYKYTVASPNGVHVLPGESPLTIESVFPQPTGGDVRIRYRQGILGRPRVEIFDSRGKLVAELTPPEAGHGTHEVVWDGSVGGRSRVPAGVYFVRISSGARFAESAIVVTSGS